MSAPVLLLDGASMWFRSYFGVPSSITAPDGRPVNAVRGFLDSVATLIARERPDRLVVCLDLDWRPAWRVELIPSHKAHRVAEEGSPVGQNPGAPTRSRSRRCPTTLSPQVDMILQVLDAFGIATAGAEGFEADDVLGPWPPPSDATRWSWSAATVTCCNWWPTTRCRSACSTSAGACRRPSCSARPKSPRNITFPWSVPGPRTPNWRCCAGTPPTGCPAYRGRREDRRRDAHPVRLAGRHPGRRPRSGLGIAQAFRAKLLAAADYIAAAEPVVRVGATPRCGSTPPTTGFPGIPPTRTGWPHQPPSTGSAHRWHGCRRQSTPPDTG